LVPVQFINRTRFTIAGCQPNHPKNSILLSPDIHSTNEASTEDVTLQEPTPQVVLRFYKSHKALDGIIYKAIIHTQAMDLNPPFFNKGLVDEWIVYYKLVNEHPKMLSYTIYEQNNNKYCEIFVQSNLAGMHAYRDITFTKILSKL
jgi:hypothetical protein